jgi:hypothetical protein
MTPRWGDADAHILRIEGFPTTRTFSRTNVRLKENVASHSQHANTFTGHAMSAASTDITDSGGWATRTAAISLK